MSLRFRPSRWDCKGEARRPGYGQVVAAGLVFRILIVLGLHDCSTEVRRGDV
jgi:hypothetical protein